MPVVAYEHQIDYAYDPDGSRFPRLGFQMAKAGNPAVMATVGEVRRIVAHYLPPLALGHLGLADPEAMHQRDPVLCLVGFSPPFALRAAHQETALS